MAVKNGPFPVLRELFVHSGLKLTVFCTTSAGETPASPGCSNLKTQSPAAIGKTDNPSTEHIVGVLVETLTDKPDEDVGLNFIFSGSSARDGYETAVGTATVMFCVVLVNKTEKLFCAGKKESFPGCVAVSSQFPMLSSFKSDPLTEQTLVVLLETLTSKPASETNESF